MTRFLQALLQVRVVPGVVLLSSLLAVGCGGSELESRWLDRGLVVDGDTRDWDGIASLAEKDDVYFAAANDDRSLYLSLRTSDQDAQRQVLLRGFTVWIDVEGGEDRTFGIRFPLGLRDAGLRPPGTYAEGERPPRGQPYFQEGGPDLDTLVALYEQSDLLLEIQREGRPPARLTMAEAEAEGVEVALKRTAGTLVYEIRVPVVAGGESSFAVMLEPGAVVGVGFETPEIDREEMRRRMEEMGGAGGEPGGGARGGGGGGRGGGSGGGGRGMGGGGRGGGQGTPEPPDPIEVWARVRTAAGPGSSGE